MTLKQYLASRPKGKFAAELGITRQQLHNIMTFKCKPSLKTALAIDRATGGKVKPKDLVQK